ncbi:MAG: ABC transporter ATP-binding protein [Actinomycetota bacterium]
MSSEAATAIVVRDLRKAYTITHRRNEPSKLSDAIVRRARRPLARADRERFEALAGITLEIGKGEAVGVIGRNGAGKSTLLKVLSRITKPTSGRVELHGRVGSLLEVGTGFHRELTGRENIFLNGSILGMKKREILGHFDSIVEFAEVSRFIDTPVKRYSSGMYVRLAFAVAAHLNPEILIVDEVLAVGDAEFQRRCLGKMDQVAREEGRTVLFVSHNMAAIEAFCPRCIYLDKGRVVADGDTRATIETYLAGAARAMADGVGSFDLESVPRPGGAVAPVLRRIELQTSEGAPTASVRMGEGLTIGLSVQGVSLPRHVVSVRLVSDAGVTIFKVDSRMKALPLAGPAGPDTVKVSVPELPLVPGRYFVEVIVYEGGKGSLQVVDRVERAAEIEVTVADVYGSGFMVPPAGRAGLVFVDAHWELCAGGSVIARTP